MARLGVNIDHVATLRQARGEFYPKVKDAAKVCLEKGCDQITIHLREDRRHIQDSDVYDVKEVTKSFKKPLNLEMGCAEDIIDLAIDVNPEWICLVPEKREERTTEGGLNLNDSAQFEKIKATCEKLKSNIEGLKISLFLEANEVIDRKAIELKSLIDAVEVHTGDYAKVFLENGNIEPHLEQFKKTYHRLKEHNIHVHAGHGLTDESVLPLVQQGLFEEYNIGHWIIAQSIFEGLGTVVEKMLSLMQKG